MPEITVLICTARNDYPYAGKAESWHCFEPFLRTLADQTYRDFEVVIVDALWESRPDWFQGRQFPFVVKHVSAQPNHWHEQGRVGISAQLNRGLIWADGRYIWTGGENNLFPPHHLALVAELSRAGQVPVGWYAIADLGFPTQRPNRMDGGGTNDGSVAVETCEPCPDVHFDMHGFTRADVLTTDHRAARFVSDPSLGLSPCHHQNYYGYSSVPLDAVIAVNGFDELMDSRMSLQDVDFGSRLVVLGCNLVMHRDLYVIEPPTKEEFGGGIRHQPSLQCNYALWQYNRITGRRVNTALPASFVSDVQEHVCRWACPLKDDCRDGRIGESKLYPFCSGENEMMAREWLSNPPVRDLGADRESRKRGDPPYDRAYITDSTR